MFSDLARDDVFRLETRRLWLRWPCAHDVADISREAAERDIAERTFDIPHPYPEGAAAEFVLTSRKANADGERLTLVLAPKEAPGRVVGAIALSPGRDATPRLGLWVAKKLWNHGLGTEATRALVDLAFGLTSWEAVEALTLADNRAAIRVLTKSVFLPAGVARVESASRGVSLEAQRFVLDRRRWSGDFGREAADAQNALSVVRA